ncbi:MAG: ATP-dependent metallopeptidase FtsH/Yme1/Tma family protein [Clostridium sp.]|jgi:cell division protease FtsH|uniref:ATP-dependent metallopeptidase FtsH/Yme1/Tma family protein n=1 Tax=Clostridium sp. TaxID=1506 RepID=UPI0025C1A0C7|nr:ATP-dependent metallopeptidase FtsH/Yme1/Tma family protein [Clostridium sp.]MCH3965008.1 ATP-dependent metallopeptidase FtsH/Yme1/Tma family protein [Clostridium sp.]MCI1714229.1 ATP-dependent metallopeptidase FtsH/Yme1/Tma family protein [Clostridium sp.]MCI1798491.1 ATP-dependent metallopeptidase FtsH/Yme1/Tma family protein [Clostridium sp.]MCI1812778.1 ATP-dependent metallopeptidase FtsH/Yme1/Tma family protein [Clostridium sp.]MCI1869300.1 ATP-dependent metallopeptidase FtsH/Yme1/Tma 
MKKIKNKMLILPILIILISLSVLILSKYIGDPITSKPYSSFKNNLEKGNIRKVYIINSQQIKFVLKDGNVYETDNPENTNFKEELLSKNIAVFKSYPLNNLQRYSSMTLVLSVIWLIAVGMKSSRIKARGSLSVDSLDAAAVENPDFTFKNMAGNEEAKESVQDVVDFLIDPEKYRSYGARIPKGIILYGEPGTGKTLLAKATAGEAGVPFYAVSGSDFVQIYVGVGASRIRQLFKKARNNKTGKSIIFIDEIDAIGKRRDGSAASGSDERDQTLNALLTEMSGFNENSGIVVMAATNRLDTLDPALLRPGRFDRHIEVTLPDISAREKIIRLHLENKPAGNIDIKEWSQKTAYFSGAKIENLINEAAIIACKENSPTIQDKHVDRAFSIVLAGYEKKNRDYIKDIDRKITSYHEIGHALVSSKVLPNEKVSKITIIPSTKGAGGYTLSIPEDRLYQNKAYLTNKMMVLLGGRAAEDIVFGSDYITTGAHNDLQRCTNIAYSMITKYGMGQALGLLNMEQLSDLNINQDSIILECRNLVDSIYNKTKKLLNENRDFLEEKSKLLLEKETLFEKDLL